MIKTAFMMFCAVFLCTLSWSTQPCKLDEGFEKIYFSACGYFSPAILAEKNFLKSHLFFSPVKENNLKV